VTAGRCVLRIKEVMALYAVSRRTVYNWMAAGKVDWADAFGHRVIYADSLPLYEDMRATREADTDKFLDGI